MQRNLTISEMPIDAIIPIEILRAIFYYLNLEDLATVKRVSKKYLQIASSQELWKEKYFQHFPLEEINKNQDIDWYKQFKTTYEALYCQLSTYERKLFSYAKEGNSQKLQSLVSLKDLDQVEWEYCSLLYWISRRCNQTLLDHIYAMIVNRFASENIVADEKGRGLLYWSIRLNQPLAPISALISKTNFTDLEQGDAKSPLYLAAKMGKLDIVKRLIEAGASLNAKYVNGGTAFSIALEYKHLDIAYFLIEKQGIDVDSGRNNLPPLYWATKYADSNLFKKIVALTKNVNAGLSSRTALHIAAKKGKLETVMCLLEKNANPNLLTENGETALILAVHNRHYATAAYLLKNNADPNIRDTKNESHIDGKTALYIAVENNDERMVALLLEHYADPNLRSKFGISPLFNAIYKGYTNIAKRLINAQANVNDVGIKIPCPIHIAVDLGNTEIIKKLIDHKVDINALWQGKSPLHIAIYNNDIETIKMLLSYDVDLTISYKTTVNDIINYSNTFSDEIKLRLKNLIQEKLLTATINPKNTMNFFTSSNNPEISFTPLEIAQIVGNEEVVQLLSNADVTHKAKKLKS